METLEETLRNNFVVGHPYQAYKVIEFIIAMIDGYFGPNLFSLEMEDAIRVYLHRMHNVGFLKYENSLMFSDTITFLDVDVSHFNKRVWTPLTVSEG